MEFRVLGPIEAIADDGTALPLGGTRPRALLAALLLEHGFSVTRESLIGGLWEAPPASASHALEVYVSRLRQTLGRDRIRCQGRAYRADVDADELDLTRFRTLARVGRDAAGLGELERAAEVLASALALWRGEPLACLNGEPLAGDARGYLREERLAVVEAEIDVRLGLGRHDALVPELHRLAVSHPSRERLWERLMLALYRCGRQVDALDVFAHVYAYLRDEVGVEPGPGLRALQRRILAHDPTLAGTAPALAPLD